MRLSAESSKITLIENLEVASGLWARTKGLLGRSHLPLDQGLWILHCNSVHTFFMQFAIDLVFVNKKMIVVKTVKGVKPGRVTLPVLSANSVIEFADGFLDKYPIRIGEKLNVDSSLS